MSARADKRADGAGRTSAPEAAVAVQATAAVTAREGGAEGEADRGGTRRADSRLGLFVRSSAFDFALVLVITLGLDFMVLSGFDATMSLRWQTAPQAGIAVVMLLALFAGAWSKRAVAGSAAAAVVVFACVLGASVVLMPGDFELFVDGQVNDAEGNYLIFALVCAALPVLVYLLSRRPAGVAALLLAATTVCAAVQYLFRDWLSEEGGLAAAAITLVAVLALLVYQTYRQSAFTAERLRTPAFGKAAVLSLVLALLCTGIGAGLFYAIVEPLQLSTPTIKPFELAVVRPVVEYTGVYSDLQVEDPDQKTSLTSDDEGDTSLDAEGEESDEELDETDAGGTLSSFAQGLIAYSQQSWAAAFSPITYEMLRLGAAVGLAALALLLAAGVLLKRWLRRRRLVHLEALPADERVIELYDFFCTRFERLGFKRAPALTPLEYAYASRRAMVPFTRNTGSVDFVRVTLLYQRAAYGTGDIGEEEYAQVVRYYQAFFDNAHRYVGTRRWLWLFWRL